MAAIAIPLRETRPIDWIGPLRTYLYSMYGSSVDFSAEVAAIHTMRQDILGVSKHANGRDLLYKYYAQLEMLDMRISVGDRACRIEFPWKNLFTGEEISQRSLAFEKASVLFNLAAVYSHIAASSPDPKQAFASFQASAGVFQFLRDNFLHAPSIDFTADTTKTLSTLMLAQAQHAFFNKAVDGNTKPGIVSKLAQSAANMYIEAASDLDELHTTRGWGPSEWYRTAELNGKSLSALAHYHYALHLEVVTKPGEAIANMREAKRLFNDLKTTKEPLAKTHIDQVKGFLELSTEKLKVLEKDNDLIYHAPIPPLINDIPHTDVAKPTAMESLYPDLTAASRVVGPELFTSVVPLEVHEKASLYSEEATQLMRKEREKVEIADQELHSALEYLDLPRSANLLRHPDEDNDPSLNGVPETVKEWASEVANTPLELDFDQKRQQILSAIERAVPNPSNQAQIQKVKQCIITGAHTDKKLQDSLKGAKEDINILKQGALGPLEQLFKFRSSSNATVNLLDIDDNEHDELKNKLDKIVSQVIKLQKIEKERGVVFSELKDRLQKDDIAGKIVANQRSTSLEELFQNELGKFKPYVSRIDATIRAQTSGLASVTELWKHVLASERVKRQASDREIGLAQRAALIDRFRHAYEVWLGVRVGAEGARKFYRDVDDLAHTLSSSGVISGLGGLSLGESGSSAAVPSGPPPPSKPAAQGSDLSAYSVPSAYDNSLYEPQWRQTDNGAPPRPAKPF